MSEEAERERILDLIVRWEDARAQGQNAAPEEICRDCPQLLSGFLRQVENLEQVDWLNLPVETGFSMGGGAWLEPPGALSLPRLLAQRYQLESLVGEGGFGRVYKGFDTWLERPVAVKIPRGNRLITAGEVDQCRIEARKVAKLHHPHIVPVHDVGREDDSCFIVGEWVEGTNLALRLQRERPSPEESARVVAEIADALEYAHRAGFVHRDIKPANILIDLEGRAYLTDFGIAVAEGDHESSRSGVGTLPYMAPELLSDTLGPVDHRADLYALGIVFFELLTGRRPFTAAHAVDLRDQILNAVPPSPRSLQPGVPEPWDGICRRAIARHPGDRYQRAEHLAANLRAALAY